MHYIEQNLRVFLENVAAGTQDIPEELFQDYQQRCIDNLKQNFQEIRSKEFSLRMSNIGMPIRQLQLQELYGRGPVDIDFILKGMYGYMCESLMMFMLKACCNVEETDGKVSLDIDGIPLKGTFDIRIDGKIYDIKSTSGYSFNNKFDDFASLLFDDSFGYIAQGFGYASASGIPFGGWIVINKVDGTFKVVEIPDGDYKALAKTYKQELLKKVRHIRNKDPMPPCTGVICETHYKKETGNKILNKSCEWCPHKFICHPGLQYLPVASSKAKNPPFKYYVELKNED